MTDDLPGADKLLRQLWVYAVIVLVLDCIALSVVNSQGVMVFNIVYLLIVIGYITLQLNKE